MVSNFDSLPPEIQNMVFQNIVFLNLHSHRRHICERTLVCKSWKDRHQRALYSNVDLLSFSELAKFLNTLENNQYLRILVVKLNCYLESGYKNRKKYSIIIKLFSLLTNLEYIDCSQGTFFTPLLDALLANHLPNLNHIEAPELYDDIPNYVSCAIILKDRLKNLEILEHLERDPESEDEDDDSFDESFFNPSEKSRIHFYRLFDRLNEFKNLEELCVSKDTADPIAFVEDLTRRSCHSLQRLELIFENDNQVDMGRLNVIPMLDITYLITYLKSDGVKADYSKLMVYLTKKFPRLEKLKFGMDTIRTTLDEMAFNLFLDYALKIKSVDLSQIPCTKQNLLQKIAPFWKCIPQSCTLSVEFTYSPSSLANKMDLKIRNAEIKNKICFFPSDTESQRKDVIKYYGRYIDCLTISQARSTFEELALQSIQHCTKLDQLSIVQSTIITPSLLSDNFLGKRRLNSLRLIDCAFTMELVCAKINELFSCINHLKITAIKPMNRPRNKNAAIEKIRINETDIGTLSLTKVALPFEHEKPALLVRISTPQATNIYIYNFYKMDDLLFKPANRKEHYELLNDSNCFLVCVTCKSLKKFQINHFGKIITLTLT